MALMVFSSIVYLMHFQAILSTNSNILLRDLRPLVLRMAVAFADMLCANSQIRPDIPNLALVCRLQWMHISRFQVQHSVQPVFNIRSDVNNSAHKTTPQRRKIIPLLLHM